VKLSELKGKVVVLEFWGVGCVPCRRLNPYIRELVKNMEDKPFVFLGICTDEKKETLTEFLEKEPMPWTHWWDGKKTVTEQWDIVGFPTLYVIDHTGVIRFANKGYNPKSGILDEMIKDLVKAAEAAK
jgi:thiol-disulfide isomerase/thioredoxin